MNKENEIINMLKQFNKGIVVDGIKSDRLILKKQDTKELAIYIENLQHQLEEKDKVINEIKNALTDYKSEWAEDDQVVKDIDTFLKILDKEGEIK